MENINPGHTAWMLIATALVMLMVPGLALFYGGMVQGKNVLSTFMHSFFALCIITIQWVTFGYTLAFGPTTAASSAASTSPSSTGSTSRAATSRSWSS